MPARPLCLLICKQAACALAVDSRRQTKQLSHRAPSPVGLPTPEPVIIYKERGALLRPEATTLCGDRYHRKGTARSYDQAAPLYHHARRLLSSRSVCRIFNNLADVGTLDGKKDFFLFEHGIDPDWDHPGNAHGGLWLVHCGECLGGDVADGIPSADTTLDSLWRHTVPSAPACRVSALTFFFSNWQALAAQVGAMRAVHCRGYVPGRRAWPPCRRNVMWRRALVGVPHRGRVLPIIDRGGRCRPQLADNRCTSRGLDTRSSGRNRSKGNRPGVQASRWSAGDKVCGVRAARGQQTAAEREIPVEHIQR